MSNYNTASIAAADLLPVSGPSDDQIVLQTVLYKDAATCPGGLTSRQCVLRIVRLSLETGVSMSLSEVADALLMLYGWSVSDKALKGYVDCAIEAYT